MKTATELRAELAAAEAAERKEATASRQRAEEAWGQTASKAETWEWKVIPTEYRDFWSKEEFKPAAKVMKRIHPAAREAFIAEHGSIPGMWGESQRPEWAGMVYYRTDENILTHNSGGTLVLKDPMLCNDEEWDAILMGNIPDKYKR